MDTALCDTKGHACFYWKHARHSRYYVFTFKLIVHQNIMKWRKRYSQNATKMVKNSMSSKFHVMFSLVFQDVKASSNGLSDEIWPISVVEAKTAQWISTIETNVNTAGWRNASKWGWGKKVIFTVYLLFASCLECCKAVARNKKIVVRSIIVYQFLQTSRDGSDLQTYTVKLWLLFVCWNFVCQLLFCWTVLPWG